MTIAGPDRITVSVAMATYNGGAFLSEQLASIAAQNVLPDELVITDDQSSDDTGDIVADFDRSAPFPVRFVRNPDRLGFAGNFMNAIRACRSDVIFLCDQDDVWMPDKIAAMVPAFGNPHVLLAYHNATVITADGSPIRGFYDGVAERVCLDVRPAHPWHASYGMTQAFRATLRAYDDLWPDSLNHIAIENERLAHDQWYFFLATVFGRVAFVDRPLVQYRQHGQNAVGAALSGTGTSRLERIAARFAHSTYHDILKARAAARRADILLRIAPRAPAKDRARVIELAQAYRMLAERLSRRRETHDGGGLARRLASLARAAGHGDYAGGSWRFDPRSLPRDLVGALSPAAIRQEG